MASGVLLRLALFLFGQAIELLNLGVGYYAAVDRERMPYNDNTDIISLLD